MPYKTIFGFIKSVFSTTVTFLNFNPANVNSLECVSMNNQECRSSIKWSVLANLKSQPRGKTFQAQI